jgi:predicted ATPase
LADSGRTRPSAARRLQALAYTLVTTGIVLALALVEWATEKFVSDRSRIEGTAIELSIVLGATLLFRPIHRSIEERVDAAFYKRKRLALAALAHVRHELTSCNDTEDALHRAISELERHLDARGCAIFLLGDGYRVRRATFADYPDELPEDDPVLAHLRSASGVVALAGIETVAPGTYAAPMHAAGHLIGVLCVRVRDGSYDAEEIEMLAGLAHDLATALLVLDPDLRRSTTVRPHNLPADLASLYGRHDERTQIHALLAREGFVTLAGSGGVGKTRLALQCGWELLDRYEHGVWFIDLAPLDDPALIVPTMLTALGVDPSGDLDALVTYLRSREALLIVDNCEQFVREVGAIITRIRAAAAQVAILVTSREILHLDGEHVFRLGALAPEDARLMLAGRAQQARAEFDAERDSEALDELCRRLDGLPLALELAAARIRVLSPREVLERLDERFRLLADGARADLPRHRTLEATIEWSYGLLDAHEQALLLRLSCFRGSFSLAAAAAVCADAGAGDEYAVLDLLTSLVDKSLLIVIAGEQTRYRLLESIRDFLRERLLAQGEIGAVAGRHAAFFGREAARAYAEFDAQMPAGWLERLAPDLDNFRAALRWTLREEGDRAVGAQLAADCGPMFLRMERLAEGIAWCQTARENAHNRASTAGRLAYVESMLRNNMGEDRAALACALSAVDALRDADDRRGLVRALSQLAQQYAKAERFDDVIAPADAAIAAARELGEPHLLAGVLRRCAYSLPPSQIERARVLFDEAAAVARGANDIDELWRILVWWSDKEAGAQQLDRAMELALAALDHVEGGSRLYLEVDVATYALAAGRIDDAESHIRAAFELARELQHPVLLALSLAYAATLIARHDPEGAAVVFSYASARLAEHEWRGGTEALACVKRTLDERLGGAIPETLVKRGQRLRLDEAIVIAGSAGHNPAGDGAADVRDGVGARLR